MNSAQLADKIRRCVCGHEHHVDDAPYVGAQECGDGEVALLHNCPACKTTYSGELLTDAAVCSRCRHAVVGDAEDPKIVALVQTTEGLESVVWCLDCGLAMTCTVSPLRAA